MSHLLKRYIFADYESLKKVKFSKLQKVCNKVFVLIDNRVEEIPFKIVLQAQKLGKRVKWISIENEKDNNFDFHISFLIGALHQKMRSEIDFAILSDNSDFDPLVDFINEAGRNCIRVKTKKKKKEASSNGSAIDKIDEEYFNDEEEDLSETISKVNSEN